MSGGTALAVGKRSIQCVAPLTPARLEFKAYSAEVKRAHEFRQLTAKQSWIKAWWLNLESNFKIYLLVVICGSEWERWYDCEWMALDDGLRAALMVQLRTLNRELSVVAWR